MKDEETQSSRAMKSGKVPGSPRSLEAMLVDVKLFSDEGMPKLKREDF